MADAPYLSVLFPYGQAVFPIQYQHIPLEILNALHTTDPSKHGFNVPNYMDINLYNFRSQLPENFPPDKGTPTRLQPVKARAFVACTLLKLPIYVSKANYTNASHHIHLARPSRNVFTIPPEAAGGFGALLTFYD